MTPCQKIQRDILLSAAKWLDGDNLSKEEKALRDKLLSGITETTVDEQYDDLIELDMHYDLESEFRGGDVETKLPAPYSRHYESKEVAKKLSDGTWVGWTYYYGGGKHGDPESIDWMQDAYNLELTETEKLVIVQEFKKV